MGRKLVLAVVVAVLGLAGCTPPIGQSPPTILEKALPYGIVGQPYSVQLEALGTAPFNWSVVSGSLPDGLALSAFGLISGTPTAAALGQNFQQFTVQASNVAGSGTRTFTIDVFTLSAPGSTVLPQSTGAPLPTGKAIAFHSRPEEGSGAGPALFQYLDNGDIEEVATLVTPTTGYGPTKPQPQGLGASLFPLLATTPGPYNRDANLTATRQGSLVMLRSGNPVNNTVVHTYHVPALMAYPARLSLSPNGQYLAVMIDNNDMWAKYVYFFSTSAPYQQTRPVVTLSHTGGWSELWTLDSSKFVSTDSSGIKVLDPVDPAGDLAPAGYQGCILTGVLANSRLAAACLSAGMNPVLQVVTGTLDGSSVRVVYEASSPTSTCVARTSSPNGQFLALACSNAVGEFLAYLEDVAMPVGVVPTPVALTSPVPYSGPPWPGGLASADWALEWSDDPWPTAL